MDTPLKLIMFVLVIFSFAIFLPSIIRYSTNGYNASTLSFNGSLWSLIPIGAIGIMFIFVFIYFLKA
jgi:hypothetical protein